MHVGAVCENILAEVGPRCSVLISSLSLSRWMAVGDLLDCLSDHIFWSDSDPFLMSADISCGSKPRT